MNKIKKQSARDVTYRFYGPDFMPADEDEGALRDVQWPRPDHWRPLKAHEIDALNQQGNLCADWSNVRVTERFNPKLVRGCRFGGFVRLGDLENFVLDFEGLHLPVGLYNSTIVSCDIGSNAAIERVGFLANTIVGKEAILYNVGQILARPGARFGNGFLWEGESEDKRDWIEVANENGKRGVAAFEGMLPADAWLWSKYRDDEALMAELRRMTDARWNRTGVRYGTIGDRTVIRNARTLIDIQVGPEALVDGADRLEDVTVQSDAQEGTRIGDGATLSHGIVGFGCQVGTGAVADHFVMGTRARLIHGARLFHTVLGDNSTVSCCEVLHSLIFPGHEQHHNNSFLIAATMQGQSNIAAGATIGSNHNSRSPDAELLAGRGFWPGLCSSFKHPSRFAAYTLTAKGHYPFEIDQPYPFSLISNNERLDCLQVVPAWWFLYNMYAVMRNTWKFQARDERRHAAQHIEFDALAPDTVEAMLAAVGRLELLAGAAALAREGGSENAVPEECRERGRRLLRETPEAVDALEIVDPELENSRRKTRLFKVPAAWGVYRAMAHYYAVRTLAGFVEAQGMTRLDALDGLLEPGERELRWVNLGGQVVAGTDLEALKARIGGGELDDWDAIHAEYDRLWQEYPRTRARHALAVLRAVNEAETGALGMEDWADFLDRAEATQEFIADQTLRTRAKDFEGAARRLTYDSPEEMRAVAGSAESDPFVARMRGEAAEFGRRLNRLREANGLAAGTR